MLSRLVARVCRQPRLVALCGAPHRNSSYFGLDTTVPVIPACYWSQLPNGVRVISEQSPCEQACVTLLCEAGSRYESPRNNGVTHLFEHMAFKGFSNLSRACLEECVINMGGKLTVHTDKEFQIFTAVCPNAFVTNVMNMFAKMFVDLQIDVVEMEFARYTIAKQMEEEEKDPRALAFYYLHKAAFQGTSLAQPVIGRLENYCTMDPSYLRCFIFNHYQPYRMVLSVFSEHSHNDVVALAQTHFGAFVESVEHNVEWTCRFTGSEARYRNDDMPYAYVCFGVEALGYDSNQYLALRLLKHILGKWDQSQVLGYSTWPRLAHACELSHLAAHYESFYLPYKDVGLFGVYLILPKEIDMEDTILMVQDQWMQLCNTITQSDVDRGAQSLKLEIARQTDGCIASCRDMALQMMYYGARQNLIEIFEAVDNIKYLEIRALATRIIYDREYVLSAIGCTEGLLGPNRTRAGMYWLRL